MPAQAICSTSASTRAHAARETWRPSIRTVKPAGAFRRSGHDLLLSCGTAAFYPAPPSMPWGESTSTGARRTDTASRVVHSCAARARAYRVLAAGLPSRSATARCSSLSTSPRR